MPDPIAKAHPKERTDEYVIEGTVVYTRGPIEREKICICCPGQPSHIFNRELVLDKFDSIYPEHFGFSVTEFVGTCVLHDNSLEGRRVRITVELLDAAMDAEARKGELMSNAREALHECGQLDRAKDAEIARLTERNQRLVGMVDVSDKKLAKAEAEVARLKTQSRETNHLYIENHAKLEQQVEKLKGLLRRALPWEYIHAALRAEIEEALK